MERLKIVSLLCLCIVQCAGLAGSAYSDDCLACHGDVMETRVVHPPLLKGCLACHDNATVGRVPHANSGKDGKGLIEDMPLLCYRCHDKGRFFKKVIHDPVRDGKCLTCHEAHGSEEQDLLVKDPLNICLDCHALVLKRPHAVAGFSGAGHPVASFSRNSSKTAKKTGITSGGIQCISCHTAHSSDWGGLYRYEARSVTGLCKYCHRH